MTKAQFIIGLFLVAAFLYPILMRVLAEKMQAKRIELYKVGDKLLDSAALNDGQKRIIQNMMDDAFSARIMFMASLAIPFHLLRRIFAPPHDVMAGIGGNTREQLDQFQDCYVKAISAANPLFAFIVALEFLIIWLPFRLLGLIRLPPKNGDNHGAASTTFRSDVTSFVSELERERCHA
jgi:hypothetical protein